MIEESWGLKAEEKYLKNKEPRPGPEKNSFPQVEVWMGARKTKMARSDYFVAWQGLCVEGPTSGETMHNQALF